MSPMTIFAFLRTSQAKRYLALGAVAFLLSAAESPAAPETAPAIPAEQSEIERFCGNIADAARDRRYAMQAAELKALQVELDQRIKTLEEKKVEYEDWMKRREEFLARAEDSVVKIYAKMKPDAAAERLSELKTELAAGILMKLDARKAGTILNEMDSKAAATLTGVMAAASRREDPS
jgi:flagellar motility protein MotE (MotC chaperone)